MKTNDSTVRVKKENKSNVASVKEKEVTIPVKDSGSKDIVSLMEEYFGCPATPMEEFQAVEASAQYAIKFVEE